MSVADWLGLPEAVQTALLILAVVFTLTPWFPGFTVGNWSVPKLDPRRRRALRWVGPITIMLAVALVMPLAALRPSPTALRLLTADGTANGDIDLVITNSGISAALLTAIELEVIRDRGLAARPALVTTATYRLPIGGLAAGQRRRLVIRHLVPAGATERIAVATETMRAASVRLSLYAADGAVLREVVELRPSSDSGGGR